MAQAATHNSSDESIARVVRTAIADAIGIDVARVTDASAMRDDLGADSLHMISAVMEIEDRFAIEIPDGELEALQTVGQAIKLVESMVTGARL